MNEVILKRIQALIEEGESIKTTRYLAKRNPFPHPRKNNRGTSYFPTVTVEPRAFEEWRTKALSLIEGITDPESVYQRNFQEEVNEPHVTDVDKGIGILTALKNDIELGKPIPDMIPVFKEPPSEKPSIEIGEYDVFLCHNSKDKAVVKEIGQRLKDKGIIPWLDEWELRPGLPWQRVLEEQISKIKSAAVFVGPNGIGPWQDLEREAYIREFIKRGCPVIPVILPDCREKPELPVFLGGMTWVDFRKRNPDPLEQLIWGITGKQGRLCRTRKGRECNS